MATGPYGKVNRLCLTWVCRRDLHVCLMHYEPSADTAEAASPKQCSLDEETMLANVTEGESNVNGQNAFPQTGAIDSDTC